MWNKLNVGLVVLLGILAVASLHAATLQTITDDDLRPDSVHYARQFKDKLNDNFSAINTNPSGTGLSSSLASGKVYVGNAGGTGTAVSVSGDASLSNAGVLTVTNTALATLKLNNAGSLTNVPGANLQAGTVGTNALSTNAYSGQVVGIATGTYWRGLLISVP